MDQAMNLKFQNHPFFPLALLHPHTQLLTVNVGGRHATMEVCACPVPRYLVTKLSSLAQKLQRVPPKLGAFVTLVEGSVRRGTCASPSQMASIAQLLLLYVLHCQQWLVQKDAFATRHLVQSSVLRAECAIVWRPPVLCCLLLVHLHHGWLDLRAVSAHKQEQFARRGRCATQERRLAPCLQHARPHLTWPGRIVG